MMLASITILISSALLITATGNSMTGNFQSCSFQCSNEDGSGPPESNHIPPSATLLRGKSGPKGEPGEDCDQATVTELMKKIRRLESHLNDTKKMEKKIDQLESDLNDTKKMEKKINQLESDLNDTKQLEIKINQLESDLNDTKQFEKKFHQLQDILDTIKKQRPQNCSEIKEGYPESTSGKYSVYESIFNPVGKEVYCDMTSEGVETLPPKNCQEVLDLDASASDGVYAIHINPSTSIDVLCDMTGGGWTVFQKRFDGSVNFRRNFNAYSVGFGSPSQEHWLGLNNIHDLTSQSGRWALRVELQRFNGDTAYAQYEDFSVGAGTGYRLSYGSHSGTAGDSLGYNNGQRFSTYDRDQDSSEYHCASDGQHAHSGAWWWGACGFANLNGYTYGRNDIGWRGMGWYYWKNGAASHAPMQRTEMKIKKF